MLKQEDFLMIRHKAQQGAYLKVIATELDVPRTVRRALGVAVTVEDASHHGRVDLTIEAFGHLYLFEFKVVEQFPEGHALQQIKDRGYADKYRATGKPIHLIVVEFSREQRQIVAFEHEPI